MKTRKYMKNSRPGRKPGQQDTAAPAENVDSRELPEETVAEDAAEAAAGENTEVSEPEHQPYWIHDQILDPDYPDGVKVLPGCTCSECGFKVSFERDKCPHCGAVMRR